MRFAQGWHRSAGWHEVGTRLRCTRLARGLHKVARGWHEVCTRSARLPKKNTPSLPSYQRLVPRFAYAGSHDGHTK